MKIKKMLPKGKGLYIWRLPRIEGGDPEKITCKAQSLGLDWICLKVANGLKKYNTSPFLHNDVQLGDLVSRMHTAGMDVWGWHSPYLYSGKDQADLMTERLDVLGLDGVIVDAEASFKQEMGASIGLEYMDRLKANNPYTAIGLACYRFPDKHRDFPWESFTPYLDFWSPMVYWVQAHNPGEQLSESIKQLNSIKRLPIIPAGSAYSQGSWIPTVDELRAFYLTVIAYELPAWLYWNWHTAENLGLMYEIAKQQSNLIGGEISRFIINELTDDIFSADTIYQSMNGLVKSVELIMQAQKGLYDKLLQVKRDLLGL